MYCRALFSSFLFVMVFCSVSPARAGDNRFQLLVQRDWGNSGFFLTFENSAPGDQPCDLPSLQLVLGVGNGSTWRYVFAYGWEFDKTYNVRAVVQPDSIEMWVNGTSVGREEIALKPVSEPLRVNTPMEGFTGLTTYIVAPKRMRITLTDKDGKEKAFRFDAPPRKLADIYQDPLRGVTREVKDFHIIPGQTVTIQTSFRLVPVDGIYKVAPLIDRYGQWAHNDWPGKVRSDEDIHNARQLEEKKYKEWGTPDIYDRYGGYLKAGWKEKPTGHWRVTQRNGQYWLVSPEGNPGFFTGLSATGGIDCEKWPPVSVTGREFLFEWLPPRGEIPFGDAWLYPAIQREPSGKTIVIQQALFITANLIRKYGNDWQDLAVRNTARRVRMWGFSGGGKWSRQNPDEIAFSWFPVLHLSGDVKIQGRLMDVFNPDACAVARKELEERVKPFKDNPWIVGLSVGNEDDGLVEDYHVTGILSMPANAPAKRALVDYATKELYSGNTQQLLAAWKAKDADGPDGTYGASFEPPLEDVRKLRAYYADKMHEFLYKTTKDLAPNKLYFGYWIPGWRATWGYTDQWYITAKHCDVLGYDHYEPIWARPELLKLIEDVKVPVLCGEFGFCRYYNFKRGFNIFGWASEVKDDTTAGRMYADWIEAAAKHPQCVGLVFFQYHDQSPLGRDPVYGFTPGRSLVAGENYAWGLVDVTDTPKWDMIEQVRKANLRANRLRQNAQSQSSHKPRK